MFIDFPDFCKLLIEVGPIAVIVLFIDVFNERIESKSIYRAVTMYASAEEVLQLRCGVTYLLLILYVCSFAVVDAKMQYFAAPFPERQKKSAYYPPKTSKAD